VLAIHPSPSRPKDPLSGSPRIHHPATGVLGRCGCTGEPANSTFSYLVTTRGRGLQTQNPCLLAGSHLDRASRTDPLHVLCMGLPKWAPSLRASICRAASATAAPARSIRTVPGVPASIVRRSAIAIWLLVSSSIGSSRMAHRGLHPFNNQWLPIILPGGKIQNEEHQR